MLIQQIGPSNMGPNWPRPRTDDEGSVHVLPDGALRHAETKGHVTHPDMRRPYLDRFLLDLPLARHLDMRPHRCRMGGCDASWSVSDADVRRELPNVIIHREGHEAVVYTTPTFLLELLHTFYGEFNARAVRRHMAGIYSANALSTALQWHQDGRQPYQLAWQMWALPSNEKIED